MEYAEAGDGTPVLVVHATPGGSDVVVGVENDLARHGAIASLELVRVPPPTLVLHGSVDTDATPDHREDAATTIPGAERVVMDGGTHLGLWTHSNAAATRQRAAALLGAPDG